MKKMKAEIKNNRLYVEYMGKKYCINVDSTGKLRLTSVDREQIVLTLNASNSVFLDSE